MKGWTWYSGQLWQVNDGQLVLWGPKCAKRNSPHPYSPTCNLIYSYKPGWFHHVYSKFWLHHLNVAAEVETRRFLNQVVLTMPTWHERPSRCHMANQLIVLMSSWTGVSKTVFAFLHFIKRVWQWSCCKRRCTCLWCCRWWSGDGRGMMGVVSGTSPGVCGKHSLSSRSDSPSACSMITPNSGKPSNFSNWNRW